ncbi:MAG: ATP-binding cassette domain-containing protein, partial [Candidatus Helarchaeota archaeon]
MRKLATNIIEVKNLSKIFDVGTNQVEAVKGISFSVREGEIFGFLGPNGAGKTTTLNMLSTLLFPTSGTAKVAGYDINNEPDMVRKNIGMVFQEMSLDIDLTGKENLELHAIMYGVDKKTRNQRIMEMLEIVQLTDKANILVKNYSGGMKRRLEIARGLLHYPKCLFLDEPTLGLDPQTRRSIWNHIKKLNEEYGITIILTTHYMEEADALCDRICIIDHGEIIALDTSENLKGHLKGDTISLEFENFKALKKFEAKIKDFAGIHAIKIITPNTNMRQMLSKMAAMRAQMSGGKKPPAIMMDPAKHGAMSKMMRSLPTKMNIIIENGSEKVASLIKIANDSGIKIKSLTIKQPSLEEVFIHYTGRSIRDENGSRGATMREIMQRRM